MSEIKIAAIMRAGVYSPNHIGNDATILNMVAEQLRKRGCEVKIYSEEQFLAGKVEESFIVNMCRDPKSIALLQKMEDEGRLVLNSGYGIENCVRERMTRILLGNNIPYPESFVVNTDEVVKNRLQKADIAQCWIKRGDQHAMHKEDVTYVRHAEEAQEMLQEYFLRGIPRAVISKHLTGDLVKFYGVKGQPFFYWFCPFVANGGKYGYDLLNTGNEAIKAMGQKIKTLCAKTADELNVKIYGGDCIISSDGEVKLISFNDWPSYAPCRVEAASSIAKAIMAEIKEYRK